MDKDISGKETHCYDMDRIGRDRIDGGPPVILRILEIDRRTKLNK